MSITAVMSASRTLARVATVDVPLMTPHLYLAVRVTVASSSKASSSRRAAPRPRLKVPVKVPGVGTPGTDVCVSTSRRPSPPAGT